MKYAKTILTLLSVFTLASCGGNSSEHSTTNTGTGSGNPSASQNSAKSDVEDTSTKFVIHAQGKEDDIYKNLSMDLTKPSHPAIEGYAFEGWYTEKEGGRKVDFSKSQPKICYGHWTDYSQLTASEKLEYFINTLTEYSGEVVHTDADESVAYQSALSEDIYVGTDHFFADRYEDTFVNFDHYTPYYAYTEDDIADEDKKYSLAEINKINHRIQIQEFYQDGNVYSVGKFDPEFRNYSKVDMKDGYSKSKMNLAKAKSTLSIGFESYFLGYPSQLLTYMQKNHEFYEASSISGDEGKEGDYYYFKNIDVTGVDPYLDSGIDFEIGFAITSTSGDYNMTSIYQATSGIAFKNGKIAHCNMTKVIGSSLNNELLEVYSYSNFYDFTQGDINRPYDGVKFKLSDFEELEDE